MTDDSKPDRPAPRLPPSGLADEILGQLARGELSAEPQEPEPDEEPSAEPLTTEAADAGAEPSHRPTRRIYSFTDSLQLADEEEEEREVFETWVEFRLGSELYALPVGQVTEILRVREVTPLPHAPFPVIGVLNLRGRVVPLFDLRQRLDLPAPPADDASRVVLVESEARRIGLMVDGVERVAQLAQSAMLPAAESDGAEIRGRYVDDDRETRLLDLEATLTLRD